MSSKGQIFTIPNLPNLTDFVQINHKTYLESFNKLNETTKQIINDFESNFSEFRIILIEKTKEKTSQERQEEYSYYLSSFRLFYTEYLGSLERLLQRQITFAFRHCRIATEASMIVYLLYKKEVTFDEIKNGKKDKNGEGKPFSVYSYCREYKRYTEGQKENLSFISKRTLDFLDDTSENSVHPNYQVVMRLSIDGFGWIHSPINEDQMTKNGLIIFEEMLAGLWRYIDSCSDLIGYGGLEHYPNINKIIELRTKLDGEREKLRRKTSS